MPDISVIILTFNSENYIGKATSSLLAKYKNEIDNGKLEIIVVDNNSQDDTVKKAKEIKSIKVFSNEENFGFAKGNNIAAAKAKGDLLLFMNPDSIIFRGDIFALRQKFEDEKVAVVGGEFLHLDGKKELSAGKFYNFFNVFLLSIGLEEKMGVRFSPKTDKFVDAVSGGFMMVKKEIFEKVNGFDEKFFMYIEDMEFCYRLKKQGFKVLFSNAATIQHVGQGSSNRSFAVVNIYKGLLYFHKKHKGTLSYYLVKTVLLAKASILVLVGKLSNNKYLDETYSKALRQLL